LFTFGFNPTFNRSILNNGILVNASEDWKPLQLLLLTKAFDRLFDTGRVLLFHWRFTGQNKADIDALLEKYEEFLMVKS
jgi:ABC-2 type transport system ATP-binding protein